MQAKPTTWPGFAFAGPADLDVCQAEQFPPGQPDQLQQPLPVVEEDGREAREVQDQGEGEVLLEVLHRKLLEWIALAVLLLFLLPVFPCGWARGCLLLLSCLALFQVSGFRFLLSKVFAVSALEDLQ